MSESLPPPIYSQQDPIDALHPRSEPQILIIPTVDAVNFQKGFLGAEGERASIEGELQIKDVNPHQWSRITISLRTIEAAYDHEIELSFFETVLFSRNDSVHSLPSSFPFAIPLMQDTPQSIKTPLSSLSHTLTATLHSLDSQIPSLVKSLVVHTRRFTPHTLSLAISPAVYALEVPTRVEAQVPRTTFTADENIPVYVTVPPPPRDIVVDHGLRLRNVRAELVQTVRVRREYVDNEESDSETEVATSYTLDDLSGHQGPSNREGSSLQDTHLPSSSKVPLSPLFLGSSFKSTIARSGASCRFHSSRPIQLRFVLHQPLPPGSPSDSQDNLEIREYRRVVNCDADCAAITQSTLLHSVTFQIKIYISFVDMANRTERISVLVIPITILPPPAPLPEVSQSVDQAYQKKHDKPPVRTVRVEDSDLAVPPYTEGGAGPSMHTSIAPPPFEERDAPPPFFLPEASTSARLPTFLESEREIILPDSSVHPMSHSVSVVPGIPGEGTEFGFQASEQFDGHSDELQRSSTPPPTLEMANMDTDLTALTDIREPGRAIEALGMVLSQHDEASADEQAPPPPPAMDDPSDPPPSIDSEYRSPEIVRQASPTRSTSSLHESFTSLDSSPSMPSPPLPPPTETQTSHGHAPPPYLNPDNHQSREQVVRPPPYVD